VELLTREIEDLQGQQARAQAQLSELEQTLERERAAHAALVAAFEDKGRHVELLTQEVSDLQAQVGKQLLELERAESVIEQVNVILK
jgi:predicted Rossmann fold nucleotide-binding protein DprA/Smf involved in DNA uptake